MARLGARGEAGEVRRVSDPSVAPRWLVSTGDGRRHEYRETGAALIRAVVADAEAQAVPGDRWRPDIAVELPDDLAADAVADLVYGVMLGSYRYRVSAADPAPVPGVWLLLPGDDDGDRDGVADYREAVRRAERLATATGVARDLANAPSNIKTPDWLARTARELLAEVALDVTVRDERWLAEYGFGGVLAVGGGSASAPRLIETTYEPPQAATHLLLVGKGITFDTGGISLKPADGMHLMRTDMAGGGAVIAAVRAIAELRLPVRVTALVPAAENHLSGSAYRPGDVVRHYGGRTTEIGNTDAEGRIVLADALAYGIERFAPDAVVDVATLTGAMKVALGLRTGGVFATDSGLAQRVCYAGELAGESWWSMPLLDAHADAVTGEVADVKQTPSGPGGITAALFLREFTSGLPWAHLDIAGPARAEDSYREVVPGGTGFGARTLVEFAASYA
ncbi:leucyl aminopeptidase family protein [Haloechinothrix sp. LS1_15]|uniref:leucyl aminopeptidase family protein n=1 Tax=Haloechinothrix sp. LS1_15 TaxID=2652248 RepID=UPI00294AEF64|nr:leucyl aminopeptidase family protein [Haloechinothrix sp. LS1_15]